MAWTVTTLSDSSEQIGLKCLASAAESRDADAIDVSSYTDGDDNDILHIEYVEWSCPALISGTASGLLTIDYNASSPQKVLELSGSGSMGVNTPGVIAKPANTGAGGFNGDLGLTSTGAATLIICLRKVTGF